MRKGGEAARRLLISLPLFSWRQAKRRPSAGPVNDAVLPSGRVLKAICHISLTLTLSLSLSEGFGGGGGGAPQSHMSVQALTGAMW